MDEKKDQIWFSILLVAISGFIFFSLGLAVAWKWGFPKHFAKVEYPVFYESESATSTTAFDGVVNLNTATVDELMQIEGVGEKTAQNIIKYRDEIGGYTFLEQLLDVAGIGETKLNRWRPYFVLDVVIATTELTATVTSTLPAVTDTTASTTVATAPFSGVLNLNTATVEELMMVSGIGEITAEKIVAYRDAIGGFTSLEQLMEIEGIGEKKLAAWRPYLTL